MQTERIPTRYFVIVILQAIGFTTARWYYIIIVIRIRRCCFRIRVVFSDPNRDGDRNTLPDESGNIPFEKRPPNGKHRPAFCGRRGTSRL